MQVKTKIFQGHFNKVKSINSGVISFFSNNRFTSITIGGRTWEHVPHSLAEKVMDIQSAVFSSLRSPIPDIIKISEPSAPFQGFAASVDMKRLDEKLNTIADIAQIRKVIVMVFTILPETAASSNKAVEKLTGNIKINLQKILAEILDHA